jgi:hypothetical protein
MCYTLALRVNTNVSLLIIFSYYHNKLFQIFQMGQHADASEPDTLWASKIVISESGHSSLIT